MLKALICPAKKWRKLLEARGQTEGCMIVPRKKDGLEIVGLSRNHPAQEVKLREEFYLALNSPAQGWASAFQCYAGEWYPLPLSGDSLIAPIKAGPVALPQTGAAGEIDYLSEPQDIGAHEFAAFILTDCEALDGFCALPLERRIPPLDLDALAAKLEKQAQRIFRLFFNVVAH